MQNNTDKDVRDKLICSMYKQSRLIGEIARKLFIDRHTVTRVLKKYNIYDDEKAKNRLSPEKIKRNEQIIREYKIGKSFRAIAKMLNVGHSTVEYVIHNYIEKAPIQYSLNVDRANLIRHRRYNFNVDYFTEIDTEEKAYWLGFLCADGCITDKMIKLELQASDKHHIEKFLIAVNAKNKKLKYRKDVNSYLTYLNSVKMVDDLKGLGCTPRKTFVLKFPTAEQVPLPLLNHFMRGYFDGDGCVYVRSKVSGVNRFTVTGNINFILEYKKNLFNAIDKHNDVLLQNTASAEIKTLALGGNTQIKKIYDFLYMNATIYLERKKEKFEIINGRLKTSSQKS